MLNWNYNFELWQVGQLQGSLSNFDVIDKNLKQIE